MLNWIKVVLLPVFIMHYKAAFISLSISVVFELTNKTNKLIVNLSPLMNKKADLHESGLNNKCQDLSKAPPFLIILTLNNVNKHLLIY